MNISDNMLWRDIHNSKRFIENTQINKEKKAKNTSVVVLAAVQLMENFIKGIKHMSAYDASSLIYSTANWMKKNTQDNFLNEAGKKIDIKIGKIYYIDYGANAFKGELAYFHYGLCIGKNKGKILIIPISSGRNIFSNCYHPINNPDKDKKFRQGLITEGFAKDCVLFMNDMKYISAGRIEKQGDTIDPDVLKDIQKQAFQISFPQLYTEYKSLQMQNKQKIEKILSQKQELSDLKIRNNHLKQCLNNCIDKNEKK